MKMLKSTTLLTGLSILLLVAGSIADTTADATSTLAPVSDPGGPYAGCAGEQVLFDDTASYDPDGEIVSYEWDFAGIGYSYGPTPTFTFLLAGTYSVELCVTDNDGNTACDVTTVSISGASAVESKSWGEIKLLLGD
jgi:PKD repeat protein